jgi:hypothetical protein
MASRKPTIYETYSKIVQRIESIDKAYRRGADMMVFADLREGKPVVVNHSFKWDGEYLTRGDDFHPGMMQIGLIAEIMQQPNTARILITKQEQTDRAEWSRLQPIREKLAPMVEKARDHAAELTQARGQLGHAEEAVKHWSGELEAAQANLARVERETAEYIGGLDIDI